MGREEQEGRQDRRKKSSQERLDAERIEKEGKKMWKIVTSCFYVVVFLYGVVRLLLLDLSGQVPTWGWYVVLIIAFGFVIHLDAHHS